MANDRLDSGRGRRLLRMLGLAVAATALVAIVMVAPTWGWVYYREYVPRSQERKLIDGALRSVLWAYLVGLVIAFVGVISLGIRLAMARRAGRRRPAWAAKALALGLGYLFAAGLMETTAGTLEFLADRVAEPPKKKEPLPEPKKREVAAKSAPGTLSIVVLGESSARGEPYQTWFSAGNALGWELERVLAGRRVEVDIKALSGCPLEKMYEVLFEEVDKAPDAVIIYSGHNEFQARFGWGRWVEHYDDDSRNFIRATLVRGFSGLTPVSRLIRDEADRQWIDSAPGLVITRGLIDRPICSPEEKAAILDLFERRLEAMVTHCERIGALPILIIPAGNDAGFDPSRSYLAKETLSDDRDAFAGRFRAAVAKESVDPVAALAAFQALVAEQPSFSESHFRLARLLEAKGDFGEARAHYILARDLDGLPMRCPSAFQDAYRRVAARHDVLLIDAQAVLEAVSPHGFLDDHLFHDGQHPTLCGYVAIAQAVLDGLAARRAFGWPEGVAPPAIDAEACARRAGMEPGRWAKVCDRSAYFLKRLAYVRHDPKFRLSKMERWKIAEEAVLDGESPESTGVPGFGVHPDGLKPPRRGPIPAGAGGH